MRLGAVIDHADETIPGPAVTPIVADTGEPIEHIVSAAIFSQLGEASLLRLEVRLLDGPAPAAAPPGLSDPERSLLAVLAGRLDEATLEALERAGFNGTAHFLRQAVPLLQRLSCIRKKE